MLMGPAAAEPDDAARGGDILGLLGPVVPAWMRDAPFHGQPRDTNSACALQHGGDDGFAQGGRSLVAVEHGYVVDYETDKQRNQYDHDGDGEGDGDDPASTHACSAALAWASSSPTMPTAADGVWFHLSRDGPADMTALPRHICPNVLASDASPHASRDKSLDRAGAEFAPLLAPSMSTRNRARAGAARRRRRTALPLTCTTAGPHDANPLAPAWSAPSQDGQSAPDAAAEAPASHGELDAAETAALPAAPTATPKQPRAGKRKQRSTVESMRAALAIYNAQSSRAVDEKPKSPLSEKHATDIAFFRHAMFGCSASATVAGAPRECDCDMCPARGGNGSQTAASMSDASQTHDVDPLVVLASALARMTPPIRATPSDLAALPWLNLVAEPMLDRNGAATAAGAAPATLVAAGCDVECPLGDLPCACHQPNGQHADGAANGRERDTPAVTWLRELLLSQPDPCRVGRELAEIVASAAKALDRDAPNGETTTGDRMRLVAVGFGQALGVADDGAAPRHTRRTAKKARRLAKGLE
jgi:hypothetical protein